MSGTLSLQKKLPRITAVVEKLSTFDPSLVNTYTIENQREAKTMAKTMTDEKKCHCTGIRNCLLCESLGGNEEDTSQAQDIWHYCRKCRKAWSQLPGSEPCCLHCGESFNFDGIDIVEEFVNSSEELAIISEIDATEWKPSQSGRRKQDFGPKVNFKRRKLKLDSFTGLPSFSEELVHRMNSTDCLRRFQPIEQCHLEYEPERGSAIDPHFDDSWLWGERLVTLNLLSDTCLLFKYNDSTGQGLESRSPYSVDVSVPMRRRSLIVVSGDARYRWMHYIPRSVINSRRVAITYRELSNEFLEGGESCEVGQEVMSIAQTYQGKAVS